MLTAVGIEVARSVPAKFWAGLIAHQYTLHGGVIRNLAGQIVGHLAMPAATAATAAIPVVGPALAAVGAASSLAANAQLVALSRGVQQVLQLSMANTALSGLGLATSIVGFVYLNARINEVDRKLTALTTDVKEIKQILNSVQRSQLLAAIDDYELASEEPDLATRRQYLQQAQRSFAVLAHHYKSQVAELSKLTEIEISEGYFVIACLGYAITTSDLGMGGKAAAQLTRHYADWKSIARQHCIKLLDLKNAARLLDGRYVDDLPAAALVRLLDFAHGTSRGIDWMDDLRHPPSKTVKIFGSGTINKAAIEFAKALQARNDVLDSYVTHFAYLAGNKVAATEFSKVLASKTDPRHAVINWVRQPLAA